MTLSDLSGPQTLFDLERLTMTFNQSQGHSQDCGWPSLTFTVALKVTAQVTTPYDHKLINISYNLGSIKVAIRSGYEDPEQELDREKQFSLETRSDSENTRILGWQINQGGARLARGTKQQEQHQLPDRRL